MIIPDWTDVDLSLLRFDKNSHAKGSTDGGFSVPSAMRPQIVILGRDMLMV